MPTATANGKKFNFPDGTTPQQMGEAIDEYFAKQTVQPPAREQRAESVLPAPVAEAVSGLNRGVAAIPDFFIDAGNAALGLAEKATGADLPSIPRVQDTLESATDGAFGQRNFMEPGLARTVVQEGSEVTGGFLPGIVAGAPQAAQKAASVSKDFLADAAPSIDALKERARGLYREIDDLGVRVNLEPVQELSDALTKTLRKEGHRPRLTPKVQGVLDELSDLTKRGEAPTISEVETARKIARQAVLSPDASEQRLGKLAVDKLDDFLQDLPQNQLTGEGAERVAPLLQDARGLWSRAKKGELIEEAFSKANLQASGLENGLRIQFRSLLNNKKAMAGFSADEKAAIEQVIKGTTGANVAKAISKLGFGEEQAVRVLVPGLGAAAGAELFGGIGALAAPAAGFVGQKVATRLTKNSAEYAGALARAGQDANKIAAAYVRNTPKGSRNPEDLAALLVGQGAPASKIESLAKSSNQTIADAAFLVGLVANISKDDVTDSEDNEGDNEG